MELKTPLRIYWDLPLTDGAPCDHQEALAQILALRVLALDLHSAGESLAPQIWEVLERVKGSGVAVTLTAAAALFTPELQLRLRALGVRGMLLAARSLREMAPLAPEVWREGAGISFPVTDASLPELPGLLGYCREHGIKRLVFPIQRALEGGALFFLGAARGLQLAEELRRIELPASLQLTIHDPLLWKAFYPERPFPEGGCQAANSMLYLAPDATVYPCPVLPYRLGALGEQTLAQIVSSQRKQQLRQRLLVAPAACLPCPELEQCLGGCRGKGHLQRQSWDDADPSCR